MKISCIYKLIDDELTQSRKEHTLGVVNTAVGLAKIYAQDIQKAEMAALFHDLYKCKTRGETNDLINEWNIGDKYIDNPNLSHSKLSAYAMKNIYGVVDQDIINAVSFHTTGRADMSLLEKIIFVADAIEPGRDYEGIDDIRALAKTNLDMCCLKLLESTIDKLKNLGQDESKIDKDTIEARNFFMEVLYEN